MKTCNGCKYAEWKRTDSGRLHPSGDGKCTYEWKLPPLPQSMYFAGFTPRILGGTISRKHNLLGHCECFAMV